MNNGHPTQEESNRIEHYEDEIELIDILRVIWKWKYLIISGAVVCGLIAAIISFNMSKIYSVDMTLRPGILSIGEEGKNVYIDSSQNIKSLIESETFDNDILKYLNDAKMNKVPKRLNFKVTILKESNIIKVKYETANINQGMVIQDRLSKLLIKEYNKLVQYFKSKYDIKWNLNKHNIDYLKAIIQSYKRNVKNIEKRNNELTTEIKLIKNGTANLVTEKNKLLSTPPQKNDGLQNLFYIYLIQQNVELSNNYQNIINDNNLKKEDQLQRVQRYTSEIEKNMDEIKKMQLQKEKIQNIQILESATKSQYPIRPKTKLNVILALVAGLFLMMFLAFLGEYLKKYKKRESL
jgi:capsular polysaccharide biosynthesis protein